MTTAELNIFVRIRAAEAQRQLAMVRTQLAQVQAQAATASAASNRPWFTGLAASGSRLQWIGRQLTTLVTGPLALAAGASVKWGIDNENAMARLKKVYGDAQHDAAYYRKEIEALDRNFTQLSNKYGTAKADVIGIGAAWSAAGSSGAALAKQTELTMKTMVIGEMEAEEATNALIAIQAQYGQNTEELTETIQQLNAVENQTGTTLKGLVQGFSRAAGVARTAGVDTAHLAAMIAALTPAAGTANEAGNALKTIISRLMSPTGEAADVMREMGIELGGVAWESMNATERMEFMAKGFENLTGPQKATASALIASRWQINKFEVAMREMNSTTGYYAKALEVLGDKQAVAKIAENELMTVLNTSGNKIKTASNIIKNSMTEAFLPLIPIFVTFMQWIAKAANSFQSLSPQVKVTILAVMLLVAAIGPLVMLLGVTKILLAQVAAFFALVGRAALMVLKPFALVGAAWSRMVARMVAGATIVRTALGAMLAFTWTWALAHGAAMQLVYAGMRAYMLMMKTLPAFLASVHMAMINLTLAWAAGTTVIQRAALSAQLALQRAWAVAAPAIASAAMATYNAVMLTWWAIQRNAAAAFYAVMSAIQGAGLAAQLAIQRAWGVASQGLAVINYSIQHALAAAYAATSRAFWAAYWAGRVALDAAFHLVSNALTVGYHAVQLALTNAYHAAQFLLNRTFWAVLMVYQTVGQTALALATKVWGRTMFLIWTVIGNLLTFNWLAMFKKMIAIAITGRAGLLAIMKGLGKGLIAALTSPIGLAIAAVVLLLVIFKDKIRTAVEGIKSYFANMPEGVAKGLAPIGKMFGKIRDVILRAFHSLPESVQKALMAVVNIVKAAAKAVYKLFSYFNPFAHHSPSLVENVTEGMAVVGDQFKNAANAAEGDVSRMYRAIQSLKGASDGFTLGNQQAKDSEARQGIVDAGGGSALPQYDALNAELVILRQNAETANAAMQDQQSVVDGLQDALDAYDKRIKAMNKSLDVLKKVQDAAAKSLDQAKASYDRYASAQIKGMREAEDAAFGNTMQQKELQLQIAKMKDTVGDVESVTDAHAKLQGQIEMLMGTQADLRKNGAGSDILGPYDDMIAKLKKQQGELGSGTAASGPGAAVKELETRLAALQRQAEIMDLEKSLKFDPLTKQIEDFTNKTEELPFESIMAGLSTSSAQVDMFTMAYDAATMAVDTQSAAIEAMQTQRDNLNDTYDIENEKLDTLKGRYEAVTTAIQDGEQALQDFQSTASEVQQRAEEAARKAEEAQKKAKGEDGEYISPGLENFRNGANGDFEDVSGTVDGIAREGGIGDQAGEIDKLTQDLASGVADSLGGLNPFQFFIDGWNKVKSWFSTQVGPFVQPIKDMFGGIGSAIELGFGDTGENLGGFAEKVRQIRDWVKNAWDMFTGFAGAIGRLFGPDLKATIGEIVDGFIGIYEKVQPQLAELGRTLQPAFEALLPVLAIVGTALIGTIQIVWEMFNGLIGPIFNFIGTALESIIGVVNGVLQVFGGLWEVIKGVFGIIKGIFTLDAGVILAGWNDVTRGIGNILGGLWDIVWAILESVISLFKNMGQAVWNIVYGFVKGVIDFFVWLWDELVGHSIVPDMINAIIEWFQMLPGRVIGFVADLVGGVISWFASLPDKAEEALINLSVFLVRKFLQAKEALMEMIPRTWQEIVDWFKSIPDKIEAALIGMNLIGKQLVEGFWEGIKSAGSWLKDKILQWVEDHIPGPIRWALEIHSPSQVTTEIGEQTAAGVAAGIENGVPGVDTAVGKVSAAITNVTLPAIPMNDVLKEFAESTDDAAARLDILKQGLSAFRTEETTAQDSLQAVNDTMRETPAALEGFTASMIAANGQIDTTTSAGSKVYSQIKDVQGAFDTAGAAAYQYALDSGASNEAAVTSAVAASANIRQQFVDQAIATGLPIDKANELANTYGLLPSDILTKLTANTDEARDAVQTFIDQNKNKEIQLRITAQTREIDEAVRQYGAFSPEAIAIANRQNADRLANGSLANRATGGWIDGPGTGTSDSILGVDAASGIPMAWVSNGEFVVNARDAQKYADVLEQINSGTFRALATGGPVVDSGAPAATDAGASPLAAALATVAFEVEKTTTEAKATWDSFVVAMTTSFNGYSTSTVAIFTAMGTSTLTAYTTMYANISTATTTFVGTQNASFTGLSAAVLAIVVAMAQQIEARYTAMWLALADQTKLSSDLVAVTFDGLATSLAGTMAEGIVPVFDQFTPMLTALEESFATTVDNVGTIWDGIKEKTAAPARFVINDVYNDGIRGAWNQFNDFLDLPPLNEQVAKFATGGSVRGAGTATSDSIPALLSNGEHVITAKEVRGAGGHAAIEATRKYWEAGQKGAFAFGGPVAAFARGGPVDPTAAPWAGGGGESNLQPAAILARRNIHKYWPQIGTIGGYRASDPYPDHPSGLALDVMTGDPYGTEVNDWLHEQKAALALNYTIWKQMYKPAGGAASMMEDRGSPTQNHMDHVHALFNANGVPGIGVGGVGSNGAPSIPMDQMVKDAINEKMDAVAKRAPEIAGGIGQWIPKSIEKGRKGLLDKLVPLAAAASKSMSDAGVPGNVESWRPMAMEAMRRNGFNADDPRQVDAMMKQIASESSGNPRAVQNGYVDVNTGGNEAVGLLQIAKGTWPGVRDPSLPDDRMDPWANMNGALRYYRGKYGDDLTTMWGHNTGYDNGGYLPVGDNQSVFNKTSRPEPVLTGSQWDAMFTIADNVLEVDDIKVGMVKAMEEVYGFEPAEAQKDAIIQGLDDWNKSFTPMILDATTNQAKGVEAIVEATGKTKTAVENFTEVGGKIKTSVDQFSKLALAFAAAMQSDTQNFGAWAPVISALGDFIGGLPDVERDWAADNPVEGETAQQRQQREAANAGINAMKGLYMGFKDVAPVVLKHTAAIGTAIEQLITQNAPIVSAAMAMMPTNPVGGAIMLLPVILQSIFTLVPMLIAAVMDIVPALIKAIMRFFTQFMPDSVYAYDDMAGAEAAIKTQQGGGAVAMGQGQRYPVQTVQSTANTNKTVNLTVYGDMVMPNVTNTDGAQTFADNLTLIASNKS